MKIFTLLLISFLSYANECQVIKELSFDYENSIALRNINTYTDNDKDNISSTRLSFNNRTQTSLYNLKIFTDIDLYSINNAPGKVQNISLPYNEAANLETGYQINSLYASFDIGENITFYHGSMPFKGGRFSEIKDPTINGGNGLPIINNQVYSSDFVDIHNQTTSEKYSINIGKSEFRTKNNYNGLLAKNDRSSGTYIIGKYETGKHFFEADFYDMTVKMEYLDYANLKIGGLGYIYDDSVGSGWTLYTNLGISNISEDVEGLMGVYHIPTAYKPYFKSKGAVVENTSNVKGYAGLFGANYEFDALGSTFNIGSELFFTRGGWVSANHGVLFLSDHSWWATRNGTEETIYIGANLSKNLRVSSKFTNTESKQVPNAFSISQNADQEDAFNGDQFYRRFQKLEFLVNYIF